MKLKVLIVEIMLIVLQRNMPANLHKRILTLCYETVFSVKFSLFTNTLMCHELEAGEISDAVLAMMFFKHYVTLIFMNSRDYCYNRLVLIDLITILRLFDARAKDVHQLFMMPILKMFTVSLKFLGSKLDFLFFLIFSASVGFYTPKTSST